MPTTRRALLTSTLAAYGVTAIASSSRRTAGPCAGRLPESADSPRRALRGRRRHRHQRARDRRCARQTPRAAIIVENKPGASGNIGAQQVSLAPPDGYTLLLGFDGSIVINPHVFANFPIDVTRDLDPVGKIGDATLIIVAHPSFPAKTLQDLIAYSKTQPGGVSYGTSGVGGTPHIAGELLNLRTGAKLVHVPYKGGGQAMTDALGGNIPTVYTAVAGAMQHVKAGRLVPIAVSSAQARGLAARRADLHRERRAGISTSTRGSACSRRRRRRRR